MFRRVLRTLTLLVGLPLSVTLAAPAVAATVIDIVDADLMEGGAAVQVTVSVACDPIGDLDQAFLSLTLWQGTYPRPNYIEGFGSYGEIGGVSLVCDGTAHEYNFTVRPSVFYADKRFRPGSAMTESSVSICTLVAPETYSCRLAGELVRERIRIRS